MRGKKRMEKNYYQKRKKLQVRDKEQETGSFWEIWKDKLVLWKEKKKRIT